MTSGGGKNRLQIIRCFDKDIATFPNRMEKWNYEKTQKRDEKILGLGRCDLYDVYL